MKWDKLKPCDNCPFLRGDAYLKGAYLEWAAFLLRAERFLKMTKDEKAKL